MNGDVMEGRKAPFAGYMYVLLPGDCCDAHVGVDHGCRSACEIRIKKILTTGRGILTISVKIQAAPWPGAYTADIADGE
jgi:hypothetical protein